MSTAALSAGSRFRAAVAEQPPLQLVGTINAYTDRMAEAIGHRAIYLSGSGLAAHSLGLSDLGVAFQIARAVRSLALTDLDDYLGYHQFEQRLYELIAGSAADQKSEDS